MQNLDWGLELVLVALLAITLVHAVRLERALRLMRNDRASLGSAIAGFDDSARQAEAGIGRLHAVSAETAQSLALRLEPGCVVEGRPVLSHRAQRGLGRSARTIWSAPVGRLSCRLRCHPRLRRPCRLGW